MSQTVRLWTTSTGMELFEAGFNSVQQTPGGGDYYLGDFSGTTLKMKSGDEGLFYLDFLVLPLGKPKMPPQVAKLLGKLKGVKFSVYLCTPQGFNRPAGVYVHKTARAEHLGGERNPTVYATRFRHLFEFAELFLKGELLPEILWPPAIKELDIEPDPGVLADRLSEGT